jgi:hypothetical protein
MNNITQRWKWIAWKVVGMSKGIKQADVSQCPAKGRLVKLAGLGKVAIAEYGMILM